ncbi:MAG: hypothetical protein J7L03_01090 [Caldisericaceae bacterium]|nr:hypothetical protein [Caldisericaceae bacterium]
MGISCSCDEYFSTISITTEMDERVVIGFEPSKGRFIITGSNTPGMEFEANSIEELEDILSTWTELSGQEIEEVLCYLLDFLPKIEVLPDFRQYLNWRKKFFSRAWRLAHPREA